MKRKITIPSPFLPMEGKLCTVPRTKYGMIRFSRQMPDNSFVVRYQKFDLGYQSLKVAPGIFEKIFQSKIKATRDVFLLLMAKVRKGKTIVYMPVQDVANTLGLKQSSVYNALAELIKLDVLTRADNNGNFHINPKVIYIGNVYELYEQYKGITTEMAGPIIHKTF